MQSSILKEYADAISSNDRARTLKIMSEALAAGTKPEELISSIFITPGELANSQTRYLKGEFERGRFFLELYEKASQMRDAEFAEFVVKGAAALTDSRDGCLRVAPERVGEVMRTRGDELCARSNCLRTGRPEAFNGPAGRYLCAPVIDGAGTGLVLCVNGKGRDYDDYDLLQLQLTANEMHKALKLRAARNEERGRTERVMRYQAALLELAKRDFQDFGSGLREMLETDSETLGVSRVSFWTFSDDRSEIICEDLCLGRGREHASGVRLKASDYPRYFKAMEDGIVIAADDAARDPRTAEFAEKYLAPLGITSMMDAPVWLNGKMVGLVCHEHTGPAREWSADDQAFAISITDSVSTLMETFERRKAELSLRESESRWKFLLEGVQVIGFDWRYLYLNEVAARHGRTSAEKLLGRTMMDAYPGIERTVLFSKLRECMETRVPKRIDNEFAFEDGSYGWFELRIEPHHDGVIVLSYDITDKKAVEQALWESRQWLELARETARMGNWELDLGANRLIWSAEAYTIYGLRPQEFGGTYEDFLKLVHPEDRAAVEETHRGALRGNLGGYEVEHRLALASGVVRRVREKSFFMRNRFGKITRAIGMVQDLDAR